MIITIKTATITICNKETALTKSIIDQIPMGEPNVINNGRYEEGGDCEVLGEVQLDRGRNERSDHWILINTPLGVRKIDECYRQGLNGILQRRGLAKIERIILIK